MTLFCHELRRGRVSLIVWTACIGLLMVTCVALYPEMAGEMDSVGDMFASMGAFTAAFGMDRLNFGTFIGFYAIECGNILGLGGAMFAAMTAAAALSGEEREGTAEFLLTHPIGRGRAVTEKLAAVLVQVVALNGVTIAVSALSCAAIGEAVSWKELGLLHLAYFLLQIELAGVCFGLSAVLRGGSAAAGLGVAAGAYFLDLIANISRQAEWLHRITPFGYAAGADILERGALDWPLVGLGIAYAAAGTALAFVWYCRKDIR